MRNALWTIVVVAVVAVTGVVILKLRQNNARLQVQVNERRLAQEMRAPASNARMSSHQKGTGEVSGIDLQTPETDRIAQLRAEISEIERKVSERVAAERAATEAMAQQRDPEKGMMRLENMQNVGKATPAAALQTLLWAAMKGDDQVMTKILGWDPKVRPQAQALIDGLPAEMRARYPTPEAVTALVFANHVLGVPAIHITKTTYQDASTVSLTVKGLTSADQHLPMRLGPGGWQLIAGEPMLKGLSRLLAGKDEK
ncbi:MAG: hypothetical protein QM760_01390 [Nibricoccus sp.]